MMDVYLLTCSEKGRDLPYSYSCYHDDLNEMVKEVCEIFQQEKGKVEFSITPSKMSRKKYNQLPEGGGW